MVSSEEPLELGLFPLGLVILPGERIPLHIFEPRYRALVADCTLESRPFVIALGSDDGIARIGCTATIDSLVRRFDDGRMNIVVEGGERVEILEQTGGRPYVTARVKALPDDDPSSDPDVQAETRDRFRRLSETIVGAAHDPRAREGTPLSYAIAGAIEIDAVIKQGLLESLSERDRLDMVDEILDRALDGVSRQEIALARAQSNGKVHLP